MSVRIEDSDLENLKAQFPDLNFSDPEREAVLLHMESLEVQAAPGSGKTTLLAAKLALIASKWPYSRRGVAIVSHTNVARAEIERRLLQSAEGRKLLEYPHFLGTIQAFVHTFLALPFLRSHGLTPQVIDDDNFANQALRSAGYYPTLDVWLKKAPGRVAPMIQSLRYEGEGLALGSANGNLPEGNSKSLPLLKKVKNNLTKKGIFRYDDMFAFATSLLSNHPGLRDTLSHRFPLVFLDEMQDTDRSQESLLEMMFNDIVVVQRFGDVNQRILSGATSTAGTFPRDGYKNVATSKRFGQAIAVVANSLKSVGLNLVGQGPHPVAPPTMILYDDATIGNVIPTFAAYVAQQFSLEELVGGTIHAVCARKQGDSKQGLGRHILDYWPTFDADVSRPGATRVKLIDVVRSLKLYSGSSSDTRESLDSVRTALLSFLQTIGFESAVQARNWRDLVDRINHDQVNALNNAVRGLILATPETQAAWSKVIDKLFDQLQPFLGSKHTKKVFRDLDYLTYAEHLDPLVGGQPVHGARNRYVATIDGKTVTINVSTIAGVKGETHLATLVLESFQQSAFDITEALPYLCGHSDSTTVKDPRLLGQLRNLYVGVTRPTRLLCLAMHRQRLNENYQSALGSQGWIFVNS